MDIHTLTTFLEKIAPLSYQEPYDNAGLLVGDPSWEIKGILTSLDATEAVVEEAVQRGCNLIVAHHPIIFKGLKKITGRHYVERTVIKAIKSDVAIYAIHTNLDNVLQKGVNTKIAERLELENISILAPKRMAVSARLLVRDEQKTALEKALKEASIKIAAVLPASTGVKPTDGSHQFEVVCDQGQQYALRKIASDFGLPADFPLSALENKSPNIGSGLIGELKKPMLIQDFLNFLKEKMKTGCVRHTQPVKPYISKIALCGGAGSFLLPAAIGQRADVFITGDFKYHEFFDADGKILIADIGHYESEQFTIDLLHEIISETFSTFAVYKTRVNTNPVHYFK